ncbi:hypothetical protein FACS189418_0020 [Clostridia bacterium]|nr:hypothetical protein FACS189418_0020 [Clostridia bacterium]
MIIKEGSIIPNVGIGSYLLDITKKELLDIIGNNYKETMRKRDSIISVENAKFWIAEDGKVDQIGVTKGFRGTYKNVISIGSTLAEVKERIGNYVEVGDTYEMENEKGICFELEDVDDWEELIAPIEFIYVFRV